MKDDLISRQAAIDALNEYFARIGKLKRRGLTKGEKAISLDTVGTIETLPSVQPEHTETHACDSERTETHESRREWYMKGYRDAQNAALHESCTDCPLYDHDRHNCPRFNHVIPTAILDAQQPRWIPCEERLPEDLEAVNITWVNHEPEPYYHDIKDKNFVATGIHYRDKWYWYSTTCADFLGEYGSNEVDEVDDAVEIIAWMPLPPSYKGG